METRRLSFDYVLSPGGAIDGAGQDDASWLLAIAPKLGIVLDNGSSPLDLEFRYTPPLAGKNAKVTHSVSLFDTVGLKL